MGALETYTKLAEVLNHLSPEAKALVEEAAAGERRPSPSPPTNLFDHSVDRPLGSGPGAAVQLKKGSSAGE